MDPGENSDNDFSMDPKPPQSDIDEGQTKVATKTLLTLPVSYTHLTLPTKA